MIKIAGSGHIGTSMSAMDIFVWIKFLLIKINFKDKIEIFYFHLKDMMLLPYIVFCML